MAFRRSVTARAKLLYQQQQRIVAPFSNIHRDDNEHLNRTDITNSKGIEICNYFQRRLYGSGNNLGVFRGSRNSFQDLRFAIPASPWPVLVRNMSSIGESSSERSEIVTDIVNVLGDEAVGGEVANEVAIAIAAGDSSFAVAAVQYLIDYVHCYTGFNWWASIAVTAVLIRLIQIPVKIKGQKNAAKLKLLHLRMKEIEEKMLSRDMNPAEGIVQTKELRKEISRTSFNCLTGAVIGGYMFCCFFLALNNMAENVPSFTEGGVFWFTDLTTPDSMYIFPILTALSFWTTVEVGFGEENATVKSSFRGSPPPVNPKERRTKSVLKVCSALTIPLTATFPKAIFCYILTASLFSHASRSVFKNPEVVKLLGLPARQPSADKRPAN